MSYQLSELEQQLVEIASGAMAKAYAPYSQFRVGAAVLTSTGEVFAGCNVENASYGLSVCAERNAIANAVSSLGGDKIEIQMIAVVNNRGVACSPCGACRQVIWEFGQETQVIFKGPQGWQIKAISSLLSDGFSL